MKFRLEIERNQEIEIREFQSSSLNLRELIGEDYILCWLYYPESKSWCKSNTMISRQSSTIIIRALVGHLQSSLRNIESDDLVMIYSGEIYFAFDFMKLILRIKTELNKGIPIFDITIENLVIDREIWTKYLLIDSLTNTHSADFARLFNDVIYRIQMHAPILKELNRNEDLMQRLKIFLYDLGNLTEIAKDRLSCLSAVYPTYIFSRFYFSETEIEYLLNFPTSNGLIVKDCIHIFLEDKSGETIVCNYHDIYSMFAKSFSLRKNISSKYAKLSKKFKGALQT